MLVGLVQLGAASLWFLSFASADRVGASVTLRRNAGISSVARLAGTDQRFVPAAGGHGRNCENSAPNCFRTKRLSAGARYSCVTCPGWTRAEATSATRHRPCRRRSSLQRYHHLQCLEELSLQLARLTLRRWRTRTKRHCWTLMPWAARGRRSSPRSARIWTMNAGFRKLLAAPPIGPAVLEALGAFQRSLTTTDGRFDRYPKARQGDHGRGGTGIRLC